jgi:hypothetical protein
MVLKMTGPWQQKTVGSWESRGGAGGSVSMDIPLPSAFTNLNGYFTRAHAVVSLVHPLLDAVPIQQAQTALIDHVLQSISIVLHLVPSSFSLLTRFVSSNPTHLVNIGPHCHLCHRTSSTLYVLLLNMLVKTRNTVTLGSCW